MRQLVYIMFTTNSHASFDLCRKENLVKHQKASKCYDHDYIMPLQFLHFAKCWLPRYAEKLSNLSVTIHALLFIFYFFKVDN